jgi:polysaccharide biosynthesis protein PslF
VRKEHRHHAARRSPRACRPRYLRPLAGTDRVLRSFGFLSTYRPTGGGLAASTAALAAALQTGTPASRVGVVRVVDRLEPTARPEVVHHLLTNAPGGEAEAASILNGFDAVIIQHDYGIYGGPDGDQLISVLARLTVPVIVVLHAVLADPTQHQRDVLEQVLAAADAVVTTTPTAHDCLLQGYLVDPARVVTIPHDASAEEYRALAGVLVDAADAAVA